MKRSRLKLLPLLAIVLVSFSMTGAMCENLADIRVRITEDMEFDLDVDAALSAAGVTPTNGKIPAGVPSMPVPIAVKKSLDLSGQAEIAKYKSKLKEVYINSITVEVVGDNTLTVDIPPVEISMGSAGTTDFSSGLIGTFPGITAGSKGEKKQMSWESGGQKKASDLIVQFSFAMQAATKLLIKGGLDAPGGKVRLKVTLDLTFTVNPLTTSK